MTPRFINKEYIAKANYLSQNVLHYNRTIDQEFINTLPDDVMFPVIPLMIHEHKSGKPCEPHIRCSIYIPNLLTGTIDEMAESGFQMCILDFEIGVFNLLPKFDDDDNSDDNSDTDVPSSPESALDPVATPV